MISNLPPSWCKASIVEVLDLNSNGKPFQQGWSPQCESSPSQPGSWGVLKTTAIQPSSFHEHENKALPASLEPREHLEVKEGDILMTCAGPRNRCGVVCFVKKTRPKLMMSGKMYRFRPNARAIDSKYLESFISSHSAQRAINEMKTGINDSGLNLTHDRFSKLVLPLAPLNEQRRITSKIEALFSELDKGIEALETAREQLKVYRQAVLKHAFEGKLTERWRRTHAAASDASITERIQLEREQRFLERMSEWHAATKLSTDAVKPRRQVVEAPKDSDIRLWPELPTSWQWVYLNQLAEHIVDGTHYTPTYTESGVPFVSAKDIRDFKIDFSNTRFIDSKEHAHLIKRCRPRYGNVLVTKSGTIGRVALVETFQDFSLFESVATIPVLPPMVPKYVAFACHYVIESFFGAASQKGVAVRHLHLEDLRRLPVPLPPVEEQLEIAQVLDSLFSASEHQAHSLEVEIAHSEVLRQSILKKAFSGGLVSQDPSDEPASVLLERIRAEKAAQGRAPAAKVPRRRKAS